MALDADVGDQVARSRGRGFGVGQSSIQAAHALLQHVLVIVEMGDRQLLLNGLRPAQDRLPDRHPVPHVVGEQVEPLVETVLV